MSHDIPETNRERAWRLARELPKHRQEQFVVSVFLELRYAEDRGRGDVVEVRRKERERCAKVADRHAAEALDGDIMVERTAERIAEDIRALPGDER